MPVAVGWANGSIVNPTLMPSSVGCEKHAAQPCMIKINILLKDQVSFNRLLGGRPNLRTV